MSPENFPLRWESTGDQWWYVSPIDWAAANGHYDIVRELLHLDSNLLIKLTSLRRLRRLETVWDDDQTQFSGVAKRRSEVAYKLLLECESKKSQNSLIAAGYGGWLLYTAASAGDGGFVKQLLEKDPLLGFGEREYGITDMFYAAARSKNSEVFRLLFDSSMAHNGVGGEIEAGNVEMSSVFRWEVKNRAVHAAARGGNLEILKELIRDCDDVLVYRDVHGSNILHSASGRGQVEIVKYLIATFDIITATDNEGNTALNVAAYRGYLPVVEILIHASPASTTSTNNSGDTFLHMAVSGFRSPGFRRLDHQMELMKQLVRGRIFDAAEIINVRNNDGSTPLHMAIIANVNSDLVELLITVPLINLNIRDRDGMTPLDLLKHRPRSPSSEILIKRFAAAGGISNCRDRVARNALVSHLKLQGLGGSSPGTTFGISDAEIFLYTGNENAFDSPDYASCSSELSQLDSFHEPSLSEDRKSLLKSLFRDPRAKSENTPTSLRQRFSEPSSNKTIVSSSEFPSPLTKKRFANGLMHGVIRALPLQSSSPSSFLSRSPVSSPRSMASPSKNDNAGSSSLKQFFNGARPRLNRNQSSFSKKAMNQYFCFGAQGLAVNDSRSCGQSNESFKHELGVGIAGENH